MNETTYNNLINIEKNSSGEIIMLSANSLTVNKLSREITVLTEKLLKEKLESGIPISALTFTGIELLFGYGKKVDFKSVYVSSVECAFLSEFISMGINQTLHSIYVNVESKVIIALPFNKQEKLCSTKVLICENVLIGKVPDIYLGGRIFGN